MHPAHALCELRGELSGQDIVHAFCAEREQQLSDIMAPIGNWRTFVPTSREQPFIVATWLTKLLVGANSCEWAAWFKTHNQRADAEKVPSTTDWTSFRLAHTVLLNKVREEYEQQGYTVTTERQNQFYLRGRVATLSGVPDLIAIKGNGGVIVDAKSTKAQPWHPAQVQLYMWAIPLALPRYKGTGFSGLLFYSDSRTSIQGTAVNEAFVKSVTGLINRVADQQQARRVPSGGECRYCDITHLDCPERAASDERIEGETEAF
jgi:hypothetical protein